MASVEYWSVPLFLRQTGRVAYPETPVPSYDGAQEARAAWRDCVIDCASYLHSHSLADTAAYARRQRDALHHGKTALYDWSYARPLYAAYKHAAQELENWATRGASWS